MAQDYYDILQPFDYIVRLLDDNKATLGLRYIAQNDEELIPEYPAALVQCDNTERILHAQLCGSCGSRCTAEFR